MTIGIITMIIMLLISVCGFAMATLAETKKVQKIGLAATVIGTIIFIIIAAVIINDSLLPA